MQNKESTAVHQRYRNKAGKVVPGVTTVIGLLNKPALVIWAWRLGLEGQDMNKVRDEAAAIGTLTHYLCECHLKGQQPNLRSYPQKHLDVATPMFKSFCREFNKLKLKAVAVEESTVSEAWQYGGTIDLVAWETKLLTLFDIKTSTGIYDEYKIQLSAYRESWNENHPDTPIEAVKVFHLDKETGGCSLIDMGNLGILHSIYFEIFKHLRAIYVLQKGTKLSSVKRRN